ncbi:MAG: SoxR reducing system RseC family protein [Thermodesulfovibrionales bacterium]|nr:SoxR reducing system RseC family protein [Thermodesulfovibrionales bacterium]
MEETGVVKEIIGPKAIVIVQTKSACDSCPGGSICKATGDEAQIEAINEVNACVGDMVRVAFKPYTYLKGSAVIYGIPALMLIIGAVIGKEYLSKIFKVADPDILSAAGGFGLFIISFIVIKIWMKGREGKKEYMPVIEEIIK